MWALLPPAPAPSAPSSAWDSLSIPLPLCLIRMQNHPSAWRIWIIIALNQGLHWEAISAHSVEQSTVSFLSNVKYVVLLWCLHLTWQDLIIIYFLWMLFKKSPWKNIKEKGFVMDVRVNWKTNMSMFAQCAGTSSVWTAMSLFTTLSTAVLAVFIRSQLSQVFDPTKNTHIE